MFFKLKGVVVTIQKTYYIKNSKKVIMKKVKFKLLGMLSMIIICAPELVLPSFKISLEHPHDLELKNLQLLKQLTKAIFDSNYDQAEQIFNKGCNINNINEYGTTLLHLAVDKHDTRAVKFLLEHGAYLSTQDNDGQTPLHLAVFENNIEIVKLILEFGDKKILNIKNNKGRTPLHYEWDLDITNLLQAKNLEQE